MVVRHAHQFALLCLISTELQGSFARCFTTPHDDTPNGQQGAVPGCACVTHAVRLELLRAESPEHTCTAFFMANGGLW